MLADVLKGRRPSKSSTSKVSLKDKIYLDPSYTLTLPDRDLDKLYDSYKSEAVRPAAGSDNEDSGCLQTVLRLLCGWK